MFYIEEKVSLPTRGPKFNRGTHLDKFGNVWNTKNDIITAPLKDRNGKLPKALRRAELRLARRVVAFNAFSGTEKQQRGYTEPGSQNRKK